MKRGYQSFKNKASKSFRKVRPSAVGRKFNGSASIKPRSTA